MGSDSNSTPQSILNSDKEITTSFKEIAEIMNLHFVDKVHLLRDRSKSVPTIEPVERLRSWLRSRPGPPLPNFELKPINLITLRKLIKNMKGGKSCGSDYIDSYCLKLAAPLIEDALLHLVNLSINTNVFPKLWKHQMIFPQHKKGEKHLAKNYRPVSHLVEIGQLVEKVVQLQIVDHFRKNNLFHENHHGGLAHHSTCTALVQIYDILLRSSEDKKISAALLLDQSAAYDLLDHRILLEKLKLYGFNENGLNWIKSYLSGRSQTVHVQTQQSAVTALGDHGTPQGSVYRVVIT